LETGTWITLEKESKDAAEAKVFSYEKRDPLGVELLAGRKAYQVTGICVPEGTLRVE
jgi:hypothetical protein